ncbi:MAG: hypothetical protein IT304_02880 [Dehalococcoidia bacterium]|nr:hypothetical protein [Dehalococcoidia bacterium]
MVNHDGGERLGAPRGPAVARANVSGQPLARPESGFGPLWHKSYSVRFSTTLSAEALVAEWRAHFDELWPRKHEFFQPVSGICPGEVAAIELPLPAGARLSTGMVVTDLRPRSFTMVTPRGHMFAGQITFAAQPCTGQVEASVDILARSGDPLYEVGLRLGGHGREDSFWSANLSRLSARFGERGRVERTARVVDGHMQWRRATNLRANAAVRTLFLRAARLLRTGRDLLARLPGGRR